MTFWRVVNLDNSIESRSSSDTRITFDLFFTLTSITACWFAALTPSDTRENLFGRQVRSRMDLYCGKKNVCVFVFKIILFEVIIRVKNDRSECESKLICGKSIFPGSSNLYSFNLKLYWNTKINFSITEAFFLIISFIILNDNPFI